MEEDDSKPLLATRPSLPDRRKRISKHAMLDKTSHIEQSKAMHSSNVRFLILRVKILTAIGIVTADQFHLLQDRFTFRIQNHSIAC